jgi:hypothetical protein
MRLFLRSDLTPWQPWWDYSDIRTGRASATNTHPALTSSPNKEANVAVSTVSLKSFPSQPLTITSEQISRYAEVAALVSELENQQKTLRAELLNLRAAGAEQELSSPYLLAFVDQVRRTVDWKTQALQLATKLYGIEQAAQWKLQVEVASPAQPITQVRVKPNPEYAAGLASAKRPVVSIGMPSESLARSGD